MEVANKHGVEFTDEVSDADLESVAGGVLAQPLPSNVVPADNTTSFEDFDQKTDQLFNLLSTVLKSTKEVNELTDRNIA